MKIRLFRILALLTVITTLFYFNGGFNIFFHQTTVRAVGDLTIDWGVPEGEPIFMITNMTPGDDEERFVSITNDADTQRPVAVRGIKTSESGDLSTQLDMVISRNGTPIYGTGSPTGAKTLAQFFAESAGPIGLPLFILNSGATSVLNFHVTFAEAAGNDFQDTSVIFDLTIGITAEIPAECNLVSFTGNPIFGTEGNDRLRGTNGNDLIFGFEGNDTINSSNGNDCVVGGPGNDTVNNSNGNDIVFGNEGNDRLNGGNGNDRMIGGPGNDTIDSGNGDDMVTGNEGNDIVKAGNGKDNVQGNEGNDDLTGNNGNDLLDGGADIDKATGNLGTDTCIAETKSSCEL